ncbi:SDR family oxidoreductase [Actinocatenispora rupis]|uniref:Short-chain dehydrogenase n=1 Tax=Actinocatenispora rupis TaxID=519421 RepID=A0A8J3J6X4_9ACTN|nr:SDR family oxidoreductase [Actinocatenispora rupis]GID10513.1 short-chain dehydrogenase [Actinocatenispora rupis]
MTTEQNTGRVALVAGATRGAGRGIATELGTTGATVYVTGRSSARDGGHRSEVDRPETIEETAALVDAAGGHGIPVRVDHTDPDQVRALVERIDADHGRLDVLVNDVWGGDHLLDWDAPVWQHSLADGLRQLHNGVDTHIVTSHFALPLMIRHPGGLVVEMTDGTAESNADFRRGTSLYYDLAKWSVLRLAVAQAYELREYATTVVALTPGWLRSEAMLAGFGVTEETWRDATVDQPHFAISESPRYVGRAVAALATDPDVARWHGQSLSSGQLAREYGFTDVDGSQPDAWRYIAEVEWAGKPADVTGYR